MNKYEFAVIVSSKLEDEDRAKTVDKVKEYITRFGGSVTEVEEWGKKKLAYEIQKMSEAYYYFVKFESAPDVPAQIEDKLRIQENILRFLCVSLDEQ